MDIEKFARKIHTMKIETVTGVPDSTLKEFCDFLSEEGEGLFENHVVPANEGAAIGIAVGEYLATGSPACVYMQNSGLGNAINPITSLANHEVYGIPMLLVIGWRGEPGTKDEPQHKFMGRITTKLLEVLEIPYSVIRKDTTEAELDEMFNRAGEYLSLNQQYAFLVTKGTFEERKKASYKNHYQMIREDVIRKIAEWLENDDIVVSTTGKISREIYELSENVKDTCNQIFLTVGGMGHANMIAYEIAKRKPERRVICIDGDGALLMHMGGLAIMGMNPLKNLIHICLDNEAHESVGGMTTGAAGINYGEIATACGYSHTFYVESESGLEEVLSKVKKCDDLTFIEIKVAVGSREDLMRPKESAEQNKIKFMKYHKVIL